MPVRILWLSNAGWAPSAYARQSALFVPRLSKLGHPAAITAFHGLQGNVLEIDGIRTYPGSIEDQWALDIAPGHYGNWRADLLITLMDAWVLSGQSLKASEMNVAHWMPVDATPLGVLDRVTLDTGGGRPIAMSRFGETQLREAGYDPLYVPHGQDSALFKPMDPEERAKIRHELGYDGKFIIGIAAANLDPCRKAFGEQFAAFAQFAQKHPESRLLVHSRVITRQGCDLRRMAGLLGIGDKVIFGDQYGQAAGTIADATMAKWYGLLDLLSNATYGEGFGCPVLDAQMCGTPVVVSDNSTGPELCGAGWAVATEPYWNRGHSSWWGRPVISAIAEAYERAFEKAASLREQAREFALAYDADRVTEEYWKPALAALEGSLKPANRASPVPVSQGDAPGIFGNKLKKRQKAGAK